MRHPFDGLNGSEQPTRRSVLCMMAGAAAGLMGVAAAASAEEIRIQATTNAIGEEGAVRPSTALLGEEGGPFTAALAEQGTAPATTEPFGEEAGQVVSRAVPGLEDGGKPATQAKGEDGGAVTTEAVNEEGGKTKALNEDGGAVTRAIGEAGGLTSQAIGEEGGPVTRALNEGGITKALFETGGPVVLVKPNTTDVPEPKLQGLWQDMADKDPAKAVQACAVLYGCKDAVKFLARHLTVEKYRLQQADAPTLTRLIRELDAEEFDTREKDETELARLGPAATAALEKTLSESKSAEQKMRLQRLIEAAKNPAALTQARRGLEVLVALKSPETKELLEKLARGDANEWLTQTARQALERASK